ncbi:thiamine pyrophosphate-binding protein [Polymorphobacter fuscus]|uniref:Thiamine pyrophosphate-binding protein n=1 Tax=Sandarakinorhabdus fusca TaxID=1439888 RepID=A0A7C9KW63_9SPHN|nr:thiamine pyrophosphate-binding protein [Polymorphobacter fuscus]KAB7648169.1 thiamine pyrophosphate-binding protein [Polymorphobacter fuscus]MQT15666.1 thiamine pyrophosphate-binding protein [Polymorphobacter fuscus]NJC08064.1 benzoylformate decarboxylase [Polymorphobacter fuscus]
MSGKVGKHVLLDLLASEGVELIFGNPGTTELPLMDALVVEDRIRYILGLNEVVVLGMADGYAQATGRLAVCSLHAAPGLGNAMGMLYNAAKAGAPILVTAGQQDMSIRLTEPLLWDDLATMARPLCKWSFEVASLAELPRAIRRAAKLALTAPTGPVFLSIPGDVLSALAPDDLDLLAPTRIGTRLRGDAGAIAAAADLIRASQSPVIFAGDAVAKSDAHAELAALAEAIGAPVYLEGMANTAAFPSNHRLYAGTVARMTPALRALMDGHDLLVSIGADLMTQSQATGVEALAPGTSVVHLDDEPWQIGKNFPADAAIQGDPKATLPELTALVADCGAQRSAGIAADLSAKKAALFARADAMADALPLQPLPVLKLIGALLPENAIVIEELLSSGMNTVRHLVPAVRPDSWFGMRGGGIGVAIPQAAGIALAHPDRPVVVLSGDGSAMYSAAALWTLAHYRLPVVTIIFNNRGYRILKQRTRAIGGHSAATDTYVEMDIDSPAIDFLALATAHGVAGVRAETLDDVRDAVTAALASDAPTLIEITVAREL